MAIDPAATESRVITGTFDVSARRIAATLFFSICRRHTRRGSRKRPDPLAGPPIDGSGLATTATTGARHDQLANATLAASFGTPDLLSRYGSDAGLADPLSRIRAIEASRAPAGQLQ